MKEIATLKANNQKLEAEKVFSDIIPNNQEQQNESEKPVTVETEVSKCRK